MYELYLSDLMDALDFDETINLKTYKAVRHAWCLVYESYFMAEYNLNEATKFGIVFG